MKYLRTNERIKDLRGYITIKERHTNYLKWKRKVYIERLYTYRERDYIHIYIKRLKKASAEIFQTWDYFEYLIYTYI